MGRAKKNANTNSPAAAPVSSLPAVASALSPTKRQYKKRAPKPAVEAAPAASALSPIKRQYKKRAPKPADAAVEFIPRKPRSSIYRGVTRHRYTGRYESHLWDKETWNPLQNKKGRQVYLGAYDNEDDAAEAYDLAAIKYWGPSTVLNFTVERYTEEMEKMEIYSREEYLATIRRMSNGFSRGVSKYRGVAKHHQNGRWEARIGRVAGNKYLYLGTYGTEEEAAASYDKAALMYRGSGAVTNFDISNYAEKKLPDEETKPAEVKEEVVATPTKVKEATVAFDQLSLEGKEEAVPKLEPMIAMDTIPELEHPWDQCLEAGFDDFPLPNDFEDTNDVLGMFDNNGLDDDLMIDESLDTTFLEDANAVNEASPTPTLSPSSPTSSVHSDVGLIVE